MKHFKIKKLQNYQGTIFGFENRFFRILRNTEKDYYFYGFYDFVEQEYRQLHKGIKLKPLKPTFIMIWSIVFNLIYIPFSLITFPIMNYFDGAKNFIKDGAWYQNVRYFNWVNIVIIIILILKIIL